MAKKTDGSKTGGSKTSGNVRATPAARGKDQNMASAQTATPTATDAPKDKPAKPAKTAADPAAPAPAEAAPAAGSRKVFGIEVLPDDEPKIGNHMALNFTKTQADAAAALSALSRRLGVRQTTLVWYAVRQLLQNAPETAPAELIGMQSGGGGGGGPVGSAPGFWVIARMGEAGQGAIGIEVREVFRRDVVEGRSFYRIKQVKDGTPTDQEKERQKALGQARRAAQHDCSLAGLTPEDVSFSRQGSDGSVTAFSSGDELSANPLNVSE